MLGEALPMMDEIRLALNAIETEHDVRVLYAAESGSRAWGFASPDSDFDVRFIYVHQRDWYLRIDEPRDVIEAMLPGDLDLSGWDLRKSLQLYHRSNIALYEWLASPIIYRESGPLAQQLRDWLPRTFRAPAGYHHYLRTAQGIAEQHLQTGTVRLKKFFYTLRALLACRWIAASGQQPPTVFVRLCEAEWVTDSERAMIDELLQAKQQSNETDASDLPLGVTDWLDKELAHAAEAARSLRSAADLGVEPLNRLLRELVAGGSV